MPIAIVGDVHLNLRKNKTFEAQRFISLIQELINAKHNTVVFAGDLLDKARPTLEEQFLLQQQLTRLSEASRVCIIPGNHEAVTKSTSTYDLWAPKGVEVGHKLSITPDIDAISWNAMRSPQRVPSEGKILITHLRANHGLIKEEYDISSLSKRYEQVFMGDLHFRYSPFDNVHYTSSPYSTKFLNKDLKGYGYIQLNDDYTWQYIDLDLPCKIKRSCKSNEVLDVLHSLKNHLIKLEVTGTTEELEVLQEFWNVQYVKVLQSTVEYQQEVSCTNVLDSIEDFVLESKSFVGKEVRVKSKIQELKG